MNSRTYLRYSPLSRRFLPSSRPLNLSLRYQSPPAPTASSDDTTVPLVVSNHEPGGVGGTLGQGTLGETVSTPTPLSTTTQKMAKGIEVLGVEVPKKPNPPEEGECCMSGCAHCIYDIYLEELESYHSDLSLSKSSILKKLEHLDGSQRKEVERNWPKDALGDFKEFQKGGKGGKGVKETAQRELEKAREGLDPATRAFLEMEAKMKKKQQEQKT
ncbi:Dpc25p [Sporobolomyces salmoneus]|uniref:Dpc25p n=1 Tax=Sporobolomyces salmoneus TaxID=183962 RepID=UPI00317C5418